MPLWENKNRSSDTPKFTTDASSGKTGTGEYYDEVFGFDAKPIQQPRRVKVEPAGFVLNMSTDASSGKTGTGEYYDEVFGFDAKPIQQPRRVKVEPAGFVLNMSMVVHAKKC